MYMYLGNAAEVIDTDPKTFSARRAEATEWYLKGYRELLPLNLGATLPPLPTIDRIGDDIEKVIPAPDDADAISTEIRREAQLQARRNAERIRDLIQRRDIYVARLSDLYGRMHDANDKDVDAKTLLRDLAITMLHGSGINSEQAVEELLERVFPSKPRKTTTFQ